MVCPHAQRGCQGSAFCCTSRSADRRCASPSPGTSFSQLWTQTKALNIQTIWDSHPHVPSPKICNRLALNLILRINTSYVAEINTIIRSKYLKVIEDFDSRFQVIQLHDGLMGNNISFLTNGFRVKATAKSIYESRVPRFLHYFLFN